MSEWYPPERDRGFHERTEELYDIENATPDIDGLIELPVLFLRDMLVYPHMVFTHFCFTRPQFTFNSSSIKRK